MLDVDRNVLGKEADFNVIRGDPGIVCSAFRCENRDWVPEFVSDGVNSEISV